MKGKKPRKAQRLNSSLCFSAEHFCHRTKFPYDMKIQHIIEIIFQNQILMFIKAACQRSLSENFTLFFCYTSMIRMKFLRIFSKHYCYSLLFTSNNWAPHQLQYTSREYISPCPRSKTVGKFLFSRIDICYLEMFRHQITIPQKTSQNARDLCLNQSFVPSSCQISAIVSRFNDITDHTHIFENHPLPVRESPALHRIHRSRPESRIRDCRTLRG